MDDAETVRVAREGRPVKQLRVSVLSGPDAGLSAVAEDALSVGTAQTNTLVLSDRRVSRIHATLSRKGTQIAVTDHGSTNGTQIGPVTVREARVEVTSGATLTVGGTALRVDDGELVVLEPGPERLGELVGAEPAMQSLFATAARVARTDVPVLVQGESGTGKELLARAIHDQSPRAERPFVTFDCGAITPTLFESALFGHARGAFTGAETEARGAVERAAGGTLFLDEIGELPPEQQTSLLGVLERRRFLRVGGETERAADIRVVAATNRDLSREVNTGAFRLDLYYRIATVRLAIPALRDRAADLPRLIDHFLAELGVDGPRDRFFDAESMKRLRRHSWPGNVRELRNVVHAAVALGAPPELISMADAAADPVAAALGKPYREAKRLVTDAFERRYLEALLEGSEGNIRQAARDADMNRSYLMELLRRHGMR